MSLCSSTHTHTHAHTCMHTHTHAHSYTCTQTHMHSYAHKLHHTHTHAHPHSTHTSSVTLSFLRAISPRSSLSSAGSGPLCNHRDAEVVVVSPPFTGWSSHDQALSHQLSLALLMEGKGICAFEMQSVVSMVVQAHSRSYKVVNLLVPEPVYVSNQCPLEAPEPLAL